MVPLPDWFALGIAIAAALAILFALVFLIAERLYPTDHARSATGTGGEAKRRTELRDYFASIQEPYREDVTIHGNHVAFYLPERDVAITFDGATYFRLDRTPTHPILVEHEMPGAHIGARLPFDTPEPQRATPSNGRIAAFEILGVPPEASPEEITAAYRRRIKEVHPDHGGDEETFHRVREAYTIARETAE